jgi:hypothetical protein
MRRGARLFLVVLAAVLSGSLLLAQEEAAKERQKVPLWLAARSFHRLEQRFREGVRLLDLPGLDVVAIGYVLSVAGGLEGLDRERPFAIGVWALDEAFEAFEVAKLPELIASVPCADEEAMLATLGKLFKSQRREGELVLLEEGPKGARLFARFEAEASRLVLSSRRDALADVDASLPAGLFPESGGPDLVLRLDAELLGFDPDWSRRAPEAAGPEDPIRQFARDLRFLELSLALPPREWTIELRAEMRPGSRSALDLEAQLARPSRVAALFDPRALFAGMAGVRWSEAARRFPAQLREFAPELEAAGELGRRERELLFGLIDLLHASFAQGSAEVAFEVGAETSLTLWAPAGEATDRDLLEFLGKLEGRLDGEAELRRAVDEHQGKAIHSLRFAEASPDVSKGRLAAPPLLLALDGGFVVCQIETSEGGSEGLKAVLDRIRARGEAPAGKSDVLFQLRFSLGALIRMKLELFPDWELGPVERAWMEKLARVREPALFEVAARKQGIAFRLRLPGALVKALGALAAEELRGRLPFWGRR